MSKTKFTKMQQAAIDIRNRNILVSAAAGSGKTAVLVERIINRILDTENPIDIDRILVMTFTRAAAAQMKERILDAINAKRSENPHDKNLIKQYALVHNAYIMTIDSFCMNVVRNHFEEIGLSPDFRMADEGEITLLKQDVLEEVLEEFYEGADSGFIEMTEVFASKKTDEALESLILALHSHAESYPDPYDWLEGCCKWDDTSAVLAEPIVDGGIKERYPWISIYVDYARRELTHVRSILDDAADLCTHEYGPAAYLPAIEDDICYIDDILGFQTYEELYESCTSNSAHEFMKLGRVTMPKGGEVTEAEIQERKRLKDRVSDIRDQYKKISGEITGLVLSMSPEIIVRGMDLMSSPTSQLIKVTKAYMERFDEKKREKNIVDFNDIEHMCLNILRKGEDTTALEYREFFEEVYVDEYQDSNYVQEEILNLIRRRDTESGNVFMVGDVKQSIYGFRNAKPEIFVDKYNRYGICPDDVEIAVENDAEPSEDVAYRFNNDAVIPADVRVDLSHNFRSRGEVLRSVNSIFEKIMTENLGGIVYDDAAALHQGRQYAESGYDYTSELNLFVSDKDNEISDREAEAMMVAMKIKQLIKEMKVSDSEAPDGIRGVRYSDIVILLRTAKGWDNVFKEVLENQGIPVYVASTTGYFETLEIKTLLNFLKIIDNPLQDIPMAAVMMSIIGNFHEEEVARIRGAFKDGYLYEAVLNYYETYCLGVDCENTGDKNDSVLSAKIKRFLDLIKYYRKKSEYTAVADILTEIIDDDYGKLIKAMPGGQKKSANLNMLLKKAMEYGKTSYKGIFQFNRYIEAIRKYEIDYGEANIADENDNTVRIMSIHKSKGLEFPVCFVSGMNKSFNMMDTRAAVLTDSRFGIATDVIDIERRLKTKSLFKISIAKKKQTEIIAEELRLLYVAMTRAKEKLILTGAVSDENTLAETIINIDKAGSYLDMYMAASDMGYVDNINVSYIHAEDLVSEVVEETVSDEVRRSQLIRHILNCDDGENAHKSGATNRAKEISNRIGYEYPYEDKGIVKLSVSELKHRSEEISDGGSEDEADLTTYLHENLFNHDITNAVNGDNTSDFADGGDDKGEDNKITVSKGALHGTAVHRIFEIWDYNLSTTREDVNGFLKHVEDEMLMEEDLLELVKVSEVFDFVNSDIAGRMKNAFLRGELYREQPFVMCDDEDDPESMLVQGIIDAYFIEDGEIVVVDYKTDKWKTEEQLISDHKVQVEYYGRALSRMLNLKLKESVIYSTWLKKSITIL